MEIEPPPFVSDLQNSVPEEERSGDKRVDKELVRSRGGEGDSRHQ